MPDAVLTHVQESLENVQLEKDTPSHITLTSDRSVFRQETKDDFCKGVGSLGQIMADINNWEVPETWRDQVDDVQNIIGPLIRKSSENAYNNFDKVVTVVTNDKNELDKQLEKCTNDIKIANDQRIEEQKRLDENKEQLRSANENLQHWMREKEKAQTAAKKCEKEFEDIKERKSKAEQSRKETQEKTKYLKWLGVGGALGGKLLDDITDAQVNTCHEKFKQQQKVLENATKSLESKSNEVNDFKNNKIPAIEKKVQESDKNIAEINNEIERLKNARKDNSIIIEKVKLCLTYVTGISGKAEVLKNSAKNFLSVCQVIVPLRDLVENLVKEKSNDFKFLHENSVEAIDDKCKVICKVWTSPADDEDNGFC